MNTLQDTQSMQPMSSIKGQLLHFYLPFGGTGLLLAWLSVGFTPSTWWLLFQVIRQFGMLWAQQRTSLLWSLLLLIVQSLMLLAAWVLLIRVAVRESARLHIMLPKKAKQASSPSAALAQLAPPPSPSEISTLIQPAQATLVHDQLAAPAIPPLVQIPYAEQHAPTRSRSVRKARLTLSEHPTQATQTTRIADVPTQVDVLPSSTTPGSSQQKASTGNSAQLPLSLQQTTYKPGYVGEQIKPTEKAGQTFSKDASRNDLYETPKPYIATDAFSKEQQVSFSEPCLVEQDKHNDDAPNNPFAIQEDILKLFQQESFLEEAEYQAKQTQPAKEQVSIFVFGNPFEGPLPDVFEHDEYLKRSIIEQGIKPLSGHDSSNPPTKDETVKSIRREKQQ